MTIITVYDNIYTRFLGGIFMKKSIKIISLFILSLIMIFIGKETVYALDASPKRFTAVSSKMTKNPTGLETNNISIKKTSDGMYIYCYDVNDKVPNNITYTKRELISDPVINYIIALGRNDKTENDFFATQAALWIYLLDSGKMKDTQYNYIAKIKTAMKNNLNNAIYKDINSMLANAKKYGEYFNEKIEINSSKVTFTLEDGYYVSNLIKVNKNAGDYSINLYNQPTGTQVKTESNGFRVRVPEKNIKEGTTEFSVSVEFNNYKTYKYVASSSVYQDMLAAYLDKSSDSVELSITKEVEELDNTVIKISKQDITNKGKELPGATLVIKDSKGKVVEEWVSGNKPKTFSKLSTGKYTLTEKIAPEGFELSEETITFRVREDGEIETVVMYNAPKKIEESVIKISKQDITTKKELEGATLVIKDSSGKEIYKWVSEKEPYIIKGLEEGTYTLTEIKAPKGYVLSEETITFVVENEKVNNVVMFNTPEVVEIVGVPDTGAFASSIPYIIGGLIIMIGSVLIYKNAKKEQ